MTQLTNASADIHIEFGRGHLPEPVDFDRDHPRAFHDEMQNRPVFAVFEGGVSFIIHGCHSGHRRHVVIDENRGITYLPPVRPPDFDFQIVVSKDGRFFVDPYGNVVTGNLLAVHQACRRCWPARDADQGKAQQDCAEPMVSKVFMVSRSHRICTYTIGQAS